MNTLSGYVREILDESEVALSALLDGVLNLSAFAKKIQPEVARRARRDVSVGTIVVALCRYEVDVRKRGSLCPKVRVETISTRTGLAEVTFAKTQSNKSRLRTLHEKTELLDADVLTITSGIREISLIVPMALVSAVRKVFRGDTPTLVLENLASLTVRFPAKYLHTPNTTFALLRPLALNRINLVEVVSTYTELTIVVAERDLERSFVVLNRFPSA